MLDAGFEMHQFMKLLIQAAVDDLAIFGTKGGGILGTEEIDIGAPDTAAGMAEMNVSMVAPLDDSSVFICTSIASSTSDDGDKTELSFIPSPLYSGQVVLTLRRILGGAFARSVGWSLTIVSNNTKMSLRDSIQSQGSVSSR